MPTTNPRVNVTISPSLDAVVARFAALQRVSKSQVLRELLEASEPSITAAVTLMEAAAKATDAVRTVLVQDMEHAQAKAERFLRDEMQSSGRTLDLVAMAEEVQGRRPGVATRSGAIPGGGSADLVPPVPKNPPTSKRGVKSQKQASGLVGREGKK